MMTLDDLEETLCMIDPLVKRIYANRRLPWMRFSLPLKRVERPFDDEPYRVTFWQDEPMNRIYHVDPVSGQCVGVS
jgi:hypothetical protein